MGSEFKFRRLERWQRGRTGDRMDLAVPLPTTASGLVLRCCPNPECQPRKFQLGNTAHVPEPDLGRSMLRRAPGSSGCTCPYCGTDGSDQSFVAPEDVEAAKAQIAWAVGEDLGDWAEQMAKEFNRAVGGRNNLLGINMTVSKSRRPHPRPWREDLLRVIVCHLCARSYGVYAIGFFCPDCGGANLSNHFKREVALIVAQLDIAEATESDGAQELAYRLLGNAHEDVVTAFETYLKSAFRFVSHKRHLESELSEARKALKGNPFQNLDRADQLYARLGVEPTSVLTEEEHELLTLSFQKRHVLGHNFGMADERYVAAAGDGSVGETVSLLADEVERFVGLCLRVVTEVERSCPEFHPQTRPDGAP